MDAWMVVWDWKNMHSAVLCDVDVHEACSVIDPHYCPGTDFEDTIWLNVYDIMEDGTETWKRDRYMFFSQGYEGSYETPTLFGYINSGTMRTGGAYRYWEGAGSTQPGTYPFDGLMSIAHIRKYKRGLCSASFRLDPHVDPATNEMVPGIEQQGADMIKEGLKCGTDPIFHINFLRGGDLLLSDAKILIGSSDCYDIYSDDLDFIHLYYYFNVIPRKNIIANSYWTFGIHLWMQLGVQKRSMGLDCFTCPKACYVNGCLVSEYWAPFIPGCSTDDIDKCTSPCRRRHCTQDQDCCGLPGVVCRETDTRTPIVYGATCNSRNLCEKESFIDVFNAGIHFDTKMQGNCKWDLSCRIAYSGFKDAMREIRNDSYRRVFFPMLASMYEKAWVEPCKPDETGDVPPWCYILECSSNEDCYDFLPQQNFDTRCSANEYNGKHYCELRPMYFYGLNTYPNQVEVVLARDKNDLEHFLLNLDEGEIDPTTGEYIREPACRIKTQYDPDHGWSPVSNQWVYGTWP